MTTFQTKLVAGGVLAAVGILLIQCALFSDGAAMCLRSAIFDAGLWVLHWATLGYAVWLGMEASHASKRLWVGWVAGLLVFAVLNAGLFWMDIPLPSMEIGDGTDNSYRR